MELAHRRYSYGTIEKDGQRYVKDGYYYIIRTEDTESYTEEEYCIHPNGTFLYRFEDDGNLDFAEGTFDSGRYDDFVIQIECFRNDWISELEFGPEDKETNIELPL